MDLAFLRVWVMGDNLDVTKATWVRSLNAFLEDFCSICMICERIWGQLKLGYEKFPIVKDRILLIFSKFVSEQGQIPDYWRSIIIVNDKIVSGTYSTEVST